MFFVEQNQLVSDWRDTHALLVVSAVTDLGSWQYLSLRQGAVVGKAIDLTYCVFNCS